MSRDDEDERDPAEGQRLDKWLWHARFARTRPAAARLVTEGHVRINAQRATTCGKRVRPGDVLTVALGGSVRVVRLRDVSERRGSSGDALKLYEAVGDAVS